MERPKKIGRNDKCPCGSNKKYKVCCINKEPVPHIFRKGHDIESEHVQKTVDYLKEKYEDHQIIDVTKLLKSSTYKQIQLMNFREKIIMVAERTEENEDVFSTRVQGDDGVNIIVLYHGAYTCFDTKKFDQAITKVEGMVNSRL